MNCQSFETIVNDLARDQIMEARVREQAILHSTSCEKCSAILRDEQMLTQDLRELVVLMQAETTPESVEASLIAEFRSRLAAQRTSRPNSFLPLAAAGGEGRRSYWAYAAVAAALVVIALGVTTMRFRNQSPVFGPASNTAVDMSTENVAANRESVTPATDTVREATENQENRIERLPRSNAKRAVSRAGTSRLRVTRNTVTIQSLEILVADVEVTTDFIPIGYSNASNVSEGGQVVRLELPRYAMARFGVPMNEERYDERVKADVWVGADGLARAIRFVQ